MKTVERHRYKDKEIFQTRTLTYNPYPMTEIESVMGLIVSNLKPESVEDIAPLNQIKVLAYRDKELWVLETKYNIGKKKTQESE